MTELVPMSLAENERIIEDGLASFVAVGNALMRIRDEELYRAAGFDGFVQYLDSKPWGMTERHAFRQIAASQVAELTHGSVNERQARELAPLLRKSSPTVVRQVYAEVVEETGGKPTAEAIRPKVRAILSTQNGGNTPTRQNKTDAEIEQHLNDLRKLIPRWEHSFVDAHSAKEARKRVQVAEEIIQWLAAEYVPAHAALVTPLAKVPT